MLPRIDARRHTQIGATDSVLLGDALQRLAPTRVVILGGAAAVEESVVEAVQAALE